MTQFGPHR